jgi:flagellar L-ring protein precursor FlgH
MVNYQTPNPNSQGGNGSVQNAEGLPPGGTIGNGSPEILPNGGLQGAWTYIPPTQARQIRMHDIVTIRVDESATSLLLGNATSRKTTSYDAVVRDWIRMVGLDTIKPAPQSDGDPRVQVNQNEVYRGDSTIRTSESLTFNIAAQVVDILPNGLIVLEGTTTLELNDNRLEVSLIGTCRSLDIDPNNTVLSRNLVNKHIKKRENGHVRDGYSRGWLTRFLAIVKPF